MLLVGEAPCLTTQARYYLLEEETGAYGVRIELGEEAASAADLSPSRSRVWELAERLLRGGVTPLTLRDVVDDWLLE